MPAFAPLECDLIDAASGAKVRTVNLPVIPRFGEELDLDPGRAGMGEGLYRVVAVRYHLRPRKIVRTDDLFGVSLYITPAAQA